MNKCLDFGELLITSLFQKRQNIWLVCRPDFTQNADSIAIKLQIRKTNLFSTRVRQFLVEWKLFLLDTELSL